jgi:hypothetical protein
MQLPFLSSLLASVDRGDPDMRASDAGIEGLQPHGADCPCWVCFWTRKLIRSLPMLEFFRQLTGKKLRLTNAFASRYRAGDFLARHTDTQYPSRVISFSFQFTKQWRVEFGGLFQALQAGDHMKIKHSFAPIFNSVTIFDVTRPVFPHMVSAVAASVTSARYAVSGWYRYAVDDDKYEGDDYPAVDEAEASLGIQPKKYGHFAPGARAQAAAATAGSTGGAQAPTADAAAAATNASDKAVSSSSADEAAVEGANASASVDGGDGEKKEAMKSIKRSQKKKKRETKRKEKKTKTKTRKKKRKKKKQKSTAKKGKHSKRARSEKVKSRSSAKQRKSSNDEL